MAVTFHGYWPTHPWYYFLGGPILMPRAIKALAISSEYRGYRADEIGKADRLVEPKRSRRLDRIEQDVLSTLRTDLARYRHLAHRLRLRRQAGGVPENPFICDDLDVSLGLAFAHVYNGYAHVVALDETRSRQLALF
ncbi:hypothetical protein [Labrenzia sp. R5_0]|jgi:hypothetical protein|uniref:hypothetical protein n=1 Tax=Labrenzia sp. R5_0 TaxID=2821108 RepID=UPI001AD98E8E|nr:hypothetical protein [Labrenzia sp. R5_0]MBO9459230.1 hypothetical protein [Labrenzia sp. R5_0]